jgi:hypothetical protein
MLIAHHTAHIPHHASRLQLLYLLIAALSAAEHLMQLLVLRACACHLLLCF